MRIKTKEELLASGWSLKDNFSESYTKNGQPHVIKYMVGKTIGSGKVPGMCELINGNGVWNITKEMIPDRENIVAKLLHEVDTCTTSE